MWVLTTTIHHNDGAVACSAVVEYEHAPADGLIQELVNMLPLTDRCPTVVITLATKGQIVGVWERVLNVNQKS